MWISPAFAGHGVVGTGSSGGGNALLIILGVFVFLGAVYVLQKRLRKRLADREDGDR